MRKHRGEPNGNTETLNSISENDNGDSDENSGISEPLDKEGDSSPPEPGEANHQDSPAMAPGEAAQPGEGTEPTTTPSDEMPLQYGDPDYYDEGGRIFLHNGTEVTPSSTEEYPALAVGYPVQYRDDCGDDGIVLRAALVTKYGDEGNCDLVVFGSSLHGGLVHETKDVPYSAAHDDPGTYGLIW